ncbi:MAG: T9SS type A sorting domain-containing protein [Bacteroidota bacterium]|nr:T9SS type A sorting domain-containing protein [Bacteroidota bacterium]
MKKILFLVIIFASLSSTSQILNPSFELVTANKPDSYNLAPYTTYYIKDTTVPNTGLKAALIKGFSSQSYSVQGAVLGVFSVTTTSLPQALWGWYKCNIQTGDSLVFNPYVYQSTVFSAAALGYSYTTVSSAIYKQFSAPINYTATAFPGTTVGTVYTGIYLSGINVDAQSVFIPQTGTWAIIDDLSLGSNPVVTSLSDNSVENSAIESVFPQPANNTAFMVYSLYETSICELNLFDYTGKHIKTIFSADKQTEGKYKAEIPVYDLAAGIYFAQLKVNGEIRSAKIMKQ